MVVAYPGRGGGARDRRRPRRAARRSRPERLGRRAGRRRRDASPRPSTAVGDGHADRRGRRLCRRAWSARTRDSRRPGERRLARAPRRMLAGAARARAALDGRDYVIPDDVKALALPALRHRVMLSPAAEIEGAQVEQVVAAAGRPDRGAALIYPTRGEQCWAAAGGRRSPPPDRARCAALSGISACRGSACCWRSWRSTPRPGAAAPRSTRR